MLIWFLINQSHSASPSDSCRYVSYKYIISFGWSKNSGSIYVKMNGSILNEKASFKMTGLAFSSKKDWGSYVVSISFFWGWSVFF